MLEPLICTSVLKALITIILLVIWIAMVSAAYFVMVKITFKVYEKTVNKNEQPGPEIRALMRELDIKVMEETELITDKTKEKIMKRDSTKGVF